LKQVLQHIRSGTLAVEVLPERCAAAGELLIANRASIISAGTEKMVLELTKKSLLGKARERPDQVRRVLDKIRQEGLVNTFRQVREKLDEPMAMGYSSAGVVLACGQGVHEFKPGDRVASNGPHAEVVAVPRNLCALVPENVSFDQASFAVLGSIALQGVRLAQCELGETVLVVGLGLVGQLTVALLKAAGMRVIGTDPDGARCELAMRMGASLAHANLAANEIEQATRGLGADAVILTASTKSNAPIELAAQAVRKKGRVVLVGDVGLELDRRPFYFKEAEFVVSCSYGPGRYDSNYEERGIDYPAAYVRWTQQRNIQAVLELMGRGRLDVEPLISHRFPIERASEAYNMIQSGSEPYLGIVLQYRESEQPPARTIQLRPAAPRNGRLGVGVLGAGNFARLVLIPKIVQSKWFRPIVLCSAGGLHATHSGSKHGFERASSDDSEVFNATDVDAIFSITQHDLHARHVVQAIQSGKHIFVEKPLCHTLAGLRDIEEALTERTGPLPIIMVGFNRRFAPLAQTLKQVFAPRSVPLTITYRFNAGAIPADHWAQVDEIGGGRIIGEACHAIDFVTWLTAALPTRVFAESIGGPHAPTITDDQCFITLRHADGSVSNIAYLAGGDKSCPKERVEVFGGGLTAILDDFSQLTVYKNGKRAVTRRRQDKGHSAEIDAFARAIASGGSAPISWSEIRTTTLASLLAVESLRAGAPLTVCHEFSPAG
jgi:predicted dehydrogenase/threonine dehydrogenase-like Zn-dependent dehydrogenase